MKFLALREEEKREREREGDPERRLSDSTKSASLPGALHNVSLNRAGWITHGSSLLVTLDLSQSSLPRSLRSARARARPSERGQREKTSRSGQSSARRCRGQCTWLHRRERATVASDGRDRPQGNNGGTMRANSIPSSDFYRFRGK